MHTTIAALPKEEQDLLDRMAHGDTAQQIADHIGTTVRTVNFRLQVMYSKYGIPPGKHRSIKLLRATGYIIG